MKTIAVLSASILPLSLLAGIYGMNFENMPQLKSEHGYWITPGAMGVSTIVLLIYFWQKGWIFQKEAEIKLPISPADPRDSN